MAFGGNASAWSIVSLIATLAALGLHCGGYGTNYWMTRYTMRSTINFGVGLWKITNCSGSSNISCTDSSIPHDSVYITPSMYATRALESVALGFLFVNTICIVLYIGEGKARGRTMAITIMMLAVFAALSSIAGMAIWILDLPEYHYPNWSMGLTVLAFILSLISAILLIPDIRQYDYSDNLKVGGDFKNLSVTEAAKMKKKRPEPAPVIEREMDSKPKIIPQHPLAAPSYQFMQYNKKKLQDGF